jgi:hypothetical protein
MLIGRQRGSSGGEKASEPNCPAGVASALEQQKRRDLRTPLPARVRVRESPPKDLVTASRRAVKLVTWVPVIPVVGEGPSGDIETVWPVLVDTGCVENHQPDGPLAGRPRIPKATLVAYRE